MNWPTKKLAEICTQITDGTHKTPRYTDSGVPFLSTQNVTPFKKGFDFLTYQRFISPEEHKELIKRCRPEKGDMLISKCGTIGRSKLIDVDYEFSIFVGLALLKLKKDSINGKFLEFLLNSNKMKREMELNAPGSTRRTLTINALESISVFLPPPMEQKKIAYVLENIQKTIIVQEKIVEKMKELKKALMKKLFTEGTQGEELKETEIGRMPKSWEIKKLSEIAAIERGKFAHRPRNDPDFYDGDIPFIQTSDVTGSGGRVKVHSQTLNKKGLAVSKVFPKGTIVITIAANIGYTGILEFDSAFPDSLIGIAPNKKMSSEFLNYYLSTQQTEMDIRSSRGTQKNINIKFLSPWPVLVPSLSEQLQIVKIFQIIDQKIEIEEKKKGLYEELFGAILEQLMTGKIRLKDINFD